MPVPQHMSSTVVLTSAEKNVKLKIRLKTLKGKMKARVCRGVNVRVRVGFVRAKLRVRVD